MVPCWSPISPSPTAFPRGSCGGRRGHPRGKASWGGESMFINRRHKPNQSYSCVLWDPKDLLEGGYDHRFRDVVLPHLLPRPSYGTRAMVGQHHGAQSDDPKRNFPSESCQILLGNVQGACGTARDSLGASRNLNASTRVWERLGILGTSWERLGASPCASLTRRRASRSI